MRCLGKRFIFATIAVICVTTATVMLDFSGDTYWKLMASIVGMFLGSQTVTDYKGGKP